MDVAVTRRVILVLGMARSGTSALTRTLGLCGAELPKSTHSVTDPIRGTHWEPDLIVDVHDRELLEPKGRRWHDVGWLAHSWFQSEEAAVIKHRLAAAYREEFGAAPLTVVKDPRICRLLPLWLPIVRELPAEPYAVIIVRNPVEVAASLAKEGNRFSFRKVQLLWLRHFLEAERDTRNVPRCFVSYENLLSDWRAVIGHINRELGLDLRPATKPAEDEIVRFVSRDVKRHHVSDEAFAARTDVPVEVKDVYQWALRACRTIPADLTILDRAFVSLAARDEKIDPIRSLYRFWRRCRQRFRSLLRTRQPADSAALDAAR